MKSSILSLLLILCCSAPVSAAGPASVPLPQPACGAGWLIDGKVATYDRETLSDRIDGEAEIFFPYGFDLLSYGRYTNGPKSFDVDIYRMGTLLDAFGMYANYRPDGGDPIDAGVDGAVTPAQLFFYQGRYFVRLQSTGDSDAGKDALSACAREVSRLLPPAAGAPGELALLAIPEVDKGSVQYKAVSLLGYDFFTRGLIADAAVGGEPARAFVVLEDSPSCALKAFHQYQGYLYQSRAQAKITDSEGRTQLTAIDPLYGNVIVEQAGRYVYGIMRLKDNSAPMPVMEKLRLRLGK